LATPGAAIREHAEAIVESALDAVVVMDADGGVLGWNRAAERIFGYERAEALGQEVAALIVPGPLRDAHRNALARLVRTGDSSIVGRRVELVAMRRDGSELPVELTVVRLPDRGGIRFAGFVRPLGEQTLSRLETVRLQKRMAFLAQAGLALDRSLELDETLRRLSELTVPELAQLTIIDLVSAAGRLSTAVASAVEPAHARELELLRARHPLTPDSPHPVVAALRSRRSQLLSAMSADFQRQIAQGDEHFALMRRLRYHSAIVVPLIARRRVLGVLSMLRMEDAPSYGPDDLVLAEDLARRAALAVDNAELFEATRRLARTLQSSLLPSALPRIDGVRLAARYRAAAQGQEVGGDFYDAFTLAPGAWGLAIGDVRGKGPRAAALTALARYTIRALCDQGAARVLERLNEAVLRDAEALPERFLTAAVGVARRDGEGLEVELAVAGHPPPLILRAGGTVEQTVATGLLIGVVPEAGYETQRLRLDPGDTLVLYTDGLTDARAPEHVLTEPELARLLERAQGLDAEALCDMLLHAATGDREPRDDIALLVVQIPA